MNRVLVNIFYSLVVLMLLCLTTLAQQSTFTGIITDTNGALMSNVNVTLRSQGLLILNSTYTNDKGVYVLKMSDTSNNQTLFIYTAIIGYKRKAIQILKDINVYNLTLEIEPIPLSEVKIKNRPNITKRGDTLSYDVNSFARVEDRHIGDVLKRLPGFTVEEDGKILFNGQAITTLYTGGDDLMGGRYSLATKSISKDMIKSIEVLKNHQPIKVLQDKILTNDIAVNLVLKDENLKYTGEGMLGVGLPKQFDIGANLIALSKNLKMLNSIKTNNSGVDLRGFHKNIGSVNTFGSTNFKNPQFLINSATIGLPALPISNYYINESGMLSLNNLVNTKSGFQLRSNLQGFIDKNNLLHYSDITNFIGNDTISFHEKQNVTQKSGLIGANLLIAKNSTNLFLNNEINVNVKRDFYLSPLTFNSLDFNQTLRNYEYDFTNNFSYIPKLSKNEVMAFSWNMKYFSNPQNQYIDQGINADFINNGIPYNNLTQNAETPTFLSSLSASYIVPNVKINQNYQIGVINEFKKLTSKIVITDFDGMQKPYFKDKGNALDWQNHEFYLNSNFNFKTENWNIILNTPIQLQLINYKQADYSLNNEIDQLTFNPNLSLSFKTGVEDYLIANLNFTNNIGDVTSVFRGNILSNYRALNSNNTDLQINKNFGVSLKYHLEKSIALTFANLTINYNRISANSIAFTTLNNQIQTTVLVPLKNNSSSLSLNTDFSKQIIALNARIQISASYNKLQTNLFINSELLPYINNNVNATFGYDTKIYNSLTMSYNARYSYSKGGRSGNKTQVFNFSSNRIDQFLTLAFNINEKLVIESSAQHLLNYQNNNVIAQLFLVNSNLKYKFSKPKIDLSADFTNLLNNKQYTTIAISSNRLSESIYNLRGRMIVLRINYIF